MKRSLKYRLLLQLILPISVGLVLAGLIAIAVAWDRIGDAHDRQLSLTARILQAVYAEDSDELKDRVRQNEVGVMALRVWDRNSIEYSTRNTINFGERPTGNGFADRRVEGRNWRVLVLNDAATGITVELAEPYAERYRAIAAVIAAVFLPLLLLLAALPVLSWLGLRQALQPLARLMGETERRTPDDLSPIDPALVPREVVPLVSALNRLLERLDRALEQERQLTALAAHELRTPLAVIKTRLQMTARADDAAARVEGFAALEAAVDRASSLVNQLLTLARLGQDGVALAPVDLIGIVRDTTADLLPLALRGDLTVEFIAPDEAVSVIGRPDLIDLAVRNLLGNAIKFTPAGGEIQVIVTAAGAVSIRDSGPGIDPALLPDLIGRFRRGPGVRVPGSGLGLAIVADAAALMDAAFRLEPGTPNQGTPNRGRAGLTATLTFRRAR